MNGQIIRTLVAKDVKLFFRNKFFTLITVLGAVFYIIIYFLMPPILEEQIELGFYAPNMPAELESLLETEGVVYQMAESEDALQDAVSEGDVPAGLALPEDLMAKIAAGQKAQVTLYLKSDITPELRNIYVTLVKGMAFTFSGQPIHLNVHETTLGPDMAGHQVAPRDRIRPLIALFVIVMETMGLSSLLAEEIQTGTIRALLVTPMNIRDLFFGKGISGVFMTFVQVLIVLGFTGGLYREPALVLVFLLVGSVLSTSVGFLIASVARDMLSSLGWGIVAIVVLSIPAFGVIFPGTVTGWAKAIPTYYLVDTLHQTANFGAGWPDAWRNLFMLIGMNAVLLAAGVWALRRKIQ